MIASSLFVVAPRPTAALLHGDEVLAFHPVMQLVPVSDDPTGHSLGHDRPSIPQEKRNHG